MDIVLDPNYTDNGWIYLSYASSEGEDEGGNTAIARAQLKDNALINLEVLYKAKPNIKKVQYFGSRLVFDKDGYLFFTIGERGNRDKNLKLSQKMATKSIALILMVPFQRIILLSLSLMPKKPFTLMVTEIYKA